MQVGMKIPKKLQPFVTKRKRYKVAYGGRGAAKSMTFAQLLNMHASGEGALVGCFREFQSSIDDSVYALLEAQAKELRIPGFKFQKNRIIHKSGGGHRFKGLARSIEAVKSMHGFKYFWLEEGQFISEDSLKILTPTLREEDSELWISANPLSSADPFSQRFIVPFLTALERDGFYEDELHYIVKVNYNDNPWFPDSLEQERLNDKKIMSQAMYEHIWEGAFNDSVDDSIILTEWFDAAIDAHLVLGIRPTGAKVVAHDPSDLGTDDKGLVYRHGIVIKEAISRNFGDIDDGCNWALDFAIDVGADFFVWDCDGVGLGLKGQVSRSLTPKGMKFHQFHGSNTPDDAQSIYKPVQVPGDGKKQKQKTNAEVFKNKRAQKYWGLRDRLFATYLAVKKGIYIDPDKLISFSSKIKDIRLLRSEICRVPRKHNALGKIQIMSKIEMKKLKIQSPNVADSVMMTEQKLPTNVVTGDVVFDTYYS